MGFICTFLLMCLTNEKQIGEILTAAECICPHISSNINKSFFCVDISINSSYIVTQHS